MLIFNVLLIVLSVLGCLVYFEGRKKNIWIWIGSYLRHQWKGRPKIEPGKTIHILFCMVDHFEPIQTGSTKKQERERMSVWKSRYPLIANKHRDSNGRPWQHTWFYPGEAYCAEYLNDLVELCKKGFGDIEFHHHHHYETSVGLRTLINASLDKFATHGALKAMIDGEWKSSYGFIHGNMALDNSRDDPKWCGVNDELIILKETGCYADFSSPTAPCESQTEKVNSIYYAKDDPQKPKSNNTGIDVEVGRARNGDLMIIQGPLALNWKKRKIGLFPTIDNAEILNSAPGTPDRVDRWVRQHIHVIGRPDWVFVKVSCHGAQNENFESLLGREADQMLEYLEKKYRDANGYKLHYVTARELFNVVYAARENCSGDPAKFMDYRIKRYEYKSPNHVR